MSTVIKRIFKQSNKASYKKKNKRGKKGDSSKNDEEDEEAYSKNKDDYSYLEELDIKMVRLVIYYILTSNTHLDILCTR